MIVRNEKELAGLQKIGHVVANTLKQMKAYAAVGMSTKELDDYGADLLKKAGAKSAPLLTYNFPGATCLSVNQVVAHGVPSSDLILQEGDLLNIDVSAELAGFWSDNGASIIVGQDVHGHTPLLQASQEILDKAIAQIHGGTKISDIGNYIEHQAHKRGFCVIKNLSGHGLGRSLHEEPFDILNYREPSDKRRFRKGMVVAVETFINTASTLAVEQADGWTMIGNKGGFAVQHEHTIVVTEHAPLILTLA